MVQTSIDGIRDLEVRAAVRLGHHETLKNALAHALEVEAVRQDHRSHRVREVAAATVRDRSKGYGPRCYGCGEKGHLRSSCPKRTLEREGERSQEGSAANSTAQQQQKYDFTIRHCSGKSHGNADALSRRPFPEDCNHCSRQESKEVVSVRMLRTDHLSNGWKDSLQHAQQEDLDIDKGQCSQA
ncbi:unnamed protein product [Parnassius apollo]|uniref:(apollo) hypothetical protein n=1 Tax=Parnassius apollo TaxID=110799 RepID=A0A8S3WF34_PARAO|nr:unnamed protein product [Parnassius apollo]